RNGRDAAVDFVETPNLAGARDVARFSGVDAGQVADAFAMLGVLAGGDVDPVLPEDRRGIDFAGAFGGGVFVGGIGLLILGRIAVVFPGDFQKAAIAFFD